MESKLMKTAELLPVPTLEFLTIEQAGTERTRPVRSHHKLLRVALAVLLIACLCTTAFAYGKVKYGLWTGFHSKGYGDVVLLNWKYDYNFPEEFLGLQFSGMSTYYGAPEGATHLEAILAPTYTMHSVSYGDHSGIRQEDGSILWAGKRIDISFGTTEIDTWKYHFSVGEDGYCDYEGVKPGSQWKMEYEGYMLYGYTVGDKLRVRWEDTEHKLVLVVGCEGAETEDEAVDIAKALIDINK